MKYTLSYLIEAYHKVLKEKEKIEIMSINSHLNLLKLFRKSYKEISGVDLDKLIKGFEMELKDKQGGE